MLSQVEIATWKQRWNALDKVIEIILDRIDLSPFTRSQTVQLLLEQLRQFGKAQFEFFLYDNYLSSTNNPYKHSLSKLDTITDDSEYAAYRLTYPIYDYVLRVILNQIATDVAEFQRRQEENASANDNQDSTIADRVRLTDWLAYQSLKAFDSYLKSPFTALTIIQKSSYARITPYAPVALIGIPYSAIHVNIDLLTIPHEVAHYIYWHGKNSSGVFLHKTLEVAIQTSLLKTWGEEIFADVVGTLIGGPIMAWSVQQMMKEVVVESFDRDDGVHPIPRIRPYIHLAVLKRMEAIGVDGVQAIHTQLQTTWNSIESKRPLPDKFSIFNQAATLKLRTLSRGVTVKENYTCDRNLLIDEVEFVVEKVLELFPQISSFPGTSWTQPTSVELLAQLDQFILEQKALVPSDLDDVPNELFSSPPTWQAQYSWAALVQTHYGQNVDTIKE